MNDNTVRIHNDGKERNESYNAYISLNLAIDGYGSTEAEAIERLKEAVFDAIKILVNMDYDNPEYVDCFGVPLKQKT